MTNKQQQLEFQSKYGGIIKGDWLVFENKGNVDLSSNQLTSLPENIKFENKGNVDLSSNQLTSLPENIKFENKGNVDLSSNQLTSLPENIKFENEGGVYIFPNINWKDVKWINKILKDELSAEEVFAIDNIEHRRIAFQYMDKTKMKALKDFKVLDEKVDEKGNLMKGDGEKNLDRFPSLVDGNMVTRYNPLHVIAYIQFGVHF